MAAENELRILSELSYIDFDKDKGAILLNPDDYINKTLTDLEINAVYLTQMPEEEYAVWESDINSQKDNWKVIAYENKNGDTGFVGVAFENVQSGEVVISYRGTEFGKMDVMDMINDAQIAVHDAALGEANQFSDAVDFANEVRTLVADLAMIPTSSRKDLEKIL